MDSKRFYELIGMFCVHFEHACLLMEDCAREIETKGGSSESDIAKKLAGFTPDKLQKFLQESLIKEFNSDNYAEIISMIFLEVLELIKRRNTLLHSKWIPPIDDEKWSSKKGVVLGKNTKPNKKGDDALYFSLTEKVLEDDVANCCRVQKIFSSVYFLLAFPNMLDSHFKISDGTLVLYPNNRGQAELTRLKRTLQ